MKYRESEEMYLETIYLLTAKSPFVRSIDVCAELGYSRPSVSRAVGLLQERGFISVSSNGAIILTDAGKQKAEEIYQRHKVITEVLLSLGASEEIADENACRIEHVITPELFEILKNYTQK